MDEFQKKLDGVIEWLRGEFVGIRSGQASPSILDSIRVENYGTKVPLNQVGSVNIEDARTLRISAWDKENITAIEQAINDANLGVGLVTDSSGLRVTFPELTGERRDQLLKLAGTKLEEARVRARGLRDEIMKTIDTQSKNKEIGEDEAFREKDNVQKKVEETNNKLENAYQEKEKEIKR